MSPIRCACGRQTTDPFLINGVRMCVICAEDLKPEVVDSRERFNRKRYGHRLSHSPGFDGHTYDFGKHSRR